MTNFVTMMVFGVFSMCLFVQVYSLTCLRCNSTDVNSRCRTGSRGKTPRRKVICLGEKSACFAVATVNEYGSAYFQRGCTSEDVCKERQDTEIEFCITCKSKFCNYDVMVLDQEVEDYLNEVRDYNYSIESAKIKAADVKKIDDSAKNIKDNVYGNKNNNSAAGIVSVLKELMSKSSTDPKKNPERLVDEVLNDHFSNFGKKIPSGDLAFGDEDIASAHNEEIDFGDNDLEELERFDFDIRMDRPKRLVKRQ